MLKSAEIEIKKEHQVLMVNKTTSFKKQGKSKGKNKKSGKKAATPPVKPKTGPKPDAECYYCKEKGHWKRNCSKYLADLKSGLVKKKKEGYADKPLFKPLPPKEGNEEKEEKKKKKKKKGTKKKKKKENKKNLRHIPVNEITLGNRKYVAPNDYYDNESEYDDLPIPFTHISDHDLDEHAAFDIENIFGTDYEINDDSIINVPLNDDIESFKLGDVVLKDPVFETSTFSENDDITYSDS
ncbi:hypothetical protein QYE76_012047 [Lolium multiflorum]|uniref:CCHC-type domain-containing protein n=1 Tax=Lolium multiflorum TaxID=4521 RepID=A0AAD8TWH2_LOLMU|nr:hypothetical protein QYE76_012047 [Lolium multiflorum]